MKEPNRSRTLLAASVLAAHMPDPNRTTRPLLPFLSPSTRLENEAFNDFDGAMLVMLSRSIDDASVNEKLIQQTVEVPQGQENDSKDT